MSKTSSSIMRRALAYATAVAAVVGIAVPTAHALPSWDPTLLVNTESFETIGGGDSTTNIELRFGDNLGPKLFWDVTNNRFTFNRPLYVGGNITSTGAITGQSLSGAQLRVSGPASVHGPLAVSGSVRTDGGLTLNDDQTAGDTVLTFGNQSGNQTITYVDSLDKFQFSDDVSVQGNMSGSSLTVDGNVTIHNVTYSFPTTQGGNGQVLVNDGSGNLTWSTVTAGNGSGDIISIHPQYPDAILFSSGSAKVGQMTQSGGGLATGLENSYQWVTTRSALQDYWIAVRVRVPNNFSSWDPVKPIEFRYKTGTSTVSENHLTVRMRDTAGVNVSLSNNAGLANTSFTTANITGVSGTFTPKQYFTVFVKLASTNTANAAAYAGFLNFNFETTTP